MFGLQYVVAHFVLIYTTSNGSSVCILTPLLCATAGEHGRSTMNREDVEFPTFDGLTLRGWLYQGTIRGPAIVMNQGVRTVINPYL